MIVEMVTFDPPPGATAEDILEDARAVVDHWRANRELIRKHFVRGEDGRLAGLYVWPSREAARRGHDAAWIARFKERTGQTPTIRYFDLFMVIDNESGTVSEFPLS